MGLALGPRAWQGFDWGHPWTQHADSAAMWCLVQAAEGLNMEVEAFMHDVGANSAKLQKLTYKVWALQWGRDAWTPNSNSNPNPNPNR